MEAQAVTKQESPDTVLSERDLELGLRDRTPRDYVIGSLCGAALAAVLYLVGQAFAPHAMLLPLALAGFGMGLLGYLDHATRLILNRHNAAFAMITAAALTLTLAPAGPAAWAPPLIAAAAAFIFLLVLSAITGFAGGGDIKLAPMPAAVLAACFPLTAALWLMVTFFLVLIGQIAAKITRHEDQHAAMAPFMAAAMVPALIVGGSYQQSLMLL